MNQKPLKAPNSRTVAEDVSDNCALILYILQG